MARMTGGSAPSAPGSRNPTQTLSHGRKSPPSPPAWILLRNFFPNNTPPAPPHRSYSWPVGEGESSPDSCPPPVLQIQATASFSLAIDRATGGSNF